MKYWSALNVDHKRTKIKYNPVYSLDVLPNFAANLAQKDDAVTKYASLAPADAQLGLALSAKENSST